MWRRALQRAAASPGLRATVEGHPAAQRVVARYVAGEDAEAGLAVARALAAEGIDLTLDHVGESVASPEEAADAAAVYRMVLDRIGELGLPAGVSVKPTQLGLRLDPEACAATVFDLAVRAAAVGGHVTLDMEDHTVTEKTVTLVERAQAAGHTNVGCAVQASLHRTPEDVRRLTACGASLRLCKGAYAEPVDLAHRDRAQIDRSYLDAARYLLVEGNEPRFATHDHRLVAALKRHAAVLGRDRSSYEFQMLHGVRPDMQRALVADGYRLRVYLPFGRDWFPYFTRRLAERPADLVFFLRALTGTASPRGDQPHETGVERHE